MPDLYEEEENEAIAETIQNLYEAKISNPKESIISNEPNEIIEENIQEVDSDDLPF